MVAMFDTTGARYAINTDSLPEEVLTTAPVDTFHLWPQTGTCQGRTMVPWRLHFPKRRAGKFKFKIANVISVIPASTVAQTIQGAEARLFMLLMLLFFGGGIIASLLSRWLAYPLSRLVIHGFRDVKRDFLTVKMVVSPGPTPPS